MTEMPANFDDDELEDVRQLASHWGMTEGEFVEYAVRKYLDSVRRDARAKLQTLPKLRIHK